MGRKSGGFEEKRFVNIKGVVRSVMVQKGGESLKGLIREAVMDSQKDRHDSGTSKGTIVGL